MSDVCSRCHIKERHIAKSGKIQWYCKDCLDQYRLEWRMKNRVKINGYARKYYTQNPEKYKEITNNWRKNNKNRIAEVNKTWRQKNKDKIKKKNARYLEKNRITVNQRAREKSKNRVLALEDTYVRQRLGGSQYDNLIPIKREQLKLLRLCKETLKT